MSEQATKVSAVTGLTLGGNTATGIEVKKSVAKGSGKPLRGSKGKGSKRLSKPAEKRAGEARGQRSADVQSFIAAGLKEATRGIQKMSADAQPSAAKAALTGPAAQPVTAAQADITDELTRGGPAFGSFVKSIGDAVASAQSQLDANLAATAKALSQTHVKVVAVYEQQLDNDGEMEAGIPKMMQLPLINYLMPTAYQWSRVFLQADLKVSEFNGANGFNIQGQSSSFGAKAGGEIGFFSASASASTSFKMGQSSSSQTTSYSRDSAAGSMHMEATLEPRGDIQLPKPLILQKGPSLKLTAESRQNIIDPNSSSDDPQIIGRETTLTAVLMDKTGAPLTGKKLEFKISDTNLDYEVLTTGGVTDAQGVFQFKVKRTGAAFDPAKPPQPCVVRVWLGLVAQDLGISM